MTKLQKTSIHKKFNVQKTKVQKIYFMTWGAKLKFEHKPVMLEECIQGLNIKPDGIYVDGTMGGAGP